MKNVVVTGADGFIGSHLTEMLLNRGYNVKALAHYNSFNSWGWLEEIPATPGLQVVSGDIRDAAFCKELLKGSDTVFHLAALIAIPYSYSAPESYIDTNVRGTLNICQAAREVGGIRVLHTSTSEVYGTAQYVPIDENHPKQPQSPYSASKIGADAIALSFYYSFSLPLTIVRPFNTYGPRQSARAIIPAVITQLAAGESIVRVGDITPTRDFNFVEDVCSAYLTIAESGQTVGKEINIATGSEVQIGELIRVIGAIMGKEFSLVTDGQRLRPDKSEVQQLKGTSALLETLTGWSPKHTLEEGLRITAGWFSRENILKRYKPGIFNQ